MTNSCMKRIVAVVVAGLTTGVLADELVLFDADAGVGAGAAFEQGVWRLSGPWDLTRFGTVEMTLAAGAAGPNVASVKFSDAEGGQFSANVNFYGA